MVLGFDVASLLAKSFVLAGLSACPMSGKVDVDVKLTVQESPYVTNVTAQWLTDNFKNDPDGTLATDGNWMVGGLTKSNIKGGYSAQFATHENRQTGDICIALKDVTYTIVYAPVVYVASDFAHMGCRYSQILAHEKRHVMTDRHTLTDYIPDIKRQLKKTAEGIPARGPFPRSEAATHQQAILQQLAASVSGIEAQLIQARRSAQAKIDTIENYTRDTAVCPGQFPKFDGSR
jgi:hypothetical protein